MSGLCHQVARPRFFSVSVVVVAMLLLVSRVRFLEIATPYE